MSTVDRDKVARVIGNARRLGIDAFHTAFALDLVAPVEGREWVPLCCSCVDRIAHRLDDDHVYRVAMNPWQSAGGCARCPYSGCDTLVVSLEVK